MSDIERNSDPRIAAGNRPPLTPEVVDLYVRRAQKLRAQVLRQGFRRVWAAVAGRTAIAGRRPMGSVRPGPAH